MKVAILATSPARNNFSVRLRSARIANHLIPMMNKNISIVIVPSCLITNAKMAIGTTVSYHIASIMYRPNGPVARQSVSISATAPECSLRSPLHFIAKSQNPDRQVSHLDIVGGYTCQTASASIGDAGLWLPM